VFRLGLLRHQHRAKEPHDEVEVRQRQVFVRVDVGVPQTLRNQNDGNRRNDKMIPFIGTGGNVSKLVHDFHAPDTLQAGYPPLMACQMASDKVSFLSFHQFPLFLIS
jgi:hypothetical protein